MTIGPPPTILFMGRIFEVPWGGVREMADSLLSAAAPIAAANGRTIEVLVPREGMCPITHPAVREVVLPRFGGNRILWDHVTVPRYANRQRNAVLYNIKLVLPEGLRIPGFTSFHDLMYFPQPKKYDWREYLLGDSAYMRLFVSRTARRAPLVHTDSVYTAQDARDLFPDQPPDKFRPILLGVDADRFAPTPWSDEDHSLWEELRARGLQEPFIFHSGGMSRRKNLRVLAEVFTRFLRTHPEYQLVLTGGAKPTVPDPALRRALYTIPRGRLLRLGTVSPRGLALLYQRASMFVFPSLYEGFGMPPLEAQAAGCPVICSRATSLAEVAGDSAILFDPRSRGELLRAMHRLTNPAERAHYIAAGRRNVERFRWTDTARAWLALADEVYTERGKRDEG